MLDFIGMSRPAGKEITRELVAGELKLQVTLARLQPDEDVAVTDLTNERALQYLGSTETAPTEILPPIGGKVPKLSRSLIYSVTRIEAMQRGPKEGRYPFPQLVAMSIVATPLWNALSTLAQEVDTDPKPETNGEESGTPPSGPT